MRKTIGTVPIMTGNELPGKNRRGPAAFKGQLFLEYTTGNYYKALDAGPDVEWTRVIMFHVSPEDSDSLIVEEDPDHVGFAKLTLN